MKLGLLATTIATTDGVYEVKTISLDEAIALASSHELDSTIRHESTTPIVSTLLGVEVKANCKQFTQQIGQSALVFKLKGRPPEGVILSKEEIEEIGYEWKLMTRTA